MVLIERTYHLEGIFRILLDYFLDICRLSDQSLLIEG